MLRTMLSKSPRDASGRFLLAQVLLSNKKLEESLSQLDQLLREFPGHLQATLERGTVLSRLSRHDEAIRVLSQLAEKYPKVHQIHVRLTIAIYNSGRMLDALAAAQRAKAHATSQAESIDASGHLIKILGSAGMLNEATAEVASIHALSGGELKVSMTYSFLTNYSDELSAADIFGIHQSITKAHAKTVTLPPAQCDRSPDRRLKIAFVSPDLREHSVPYFLRPLLRHLPRDQFQIYCYSAGFVTDHVTAELEKLSDVFRDVRSLNDAQLASLIRQDQIDIAIDIAGLCTNSRITAFALAPAPVQLSWCGYPNTSGTPHIGYRFVDQLTDPDWSDALHTEKLVRLPGCFLCFDPGPFPPIAPLPDGPIVFTSFNAPNKLSPSTADLWSKVLQAIPGSKLQLKGPPFSHAQVRERYMKLFVDRGAPADAIRIVGSTPDRASHLAMYSQTHIGLDPFPYNGTTTTCEALAMGVPVITFALDSRRDRHAARVGRSLLTAAGLTELIAESPDDFVTLCRELAADRPRLAQYRSTLRDQLLASSLCNQPAFAANFAAALRSCWQTYVSSNT